MITRLLPVLAVCLLAAFVLGQPDAASEERKQLRGVWEVVGFEADGQAEDELIGATVAFGEKTLQLADLPVMRYRIDPGKEPKWIDATIEAGKDTTLTSGMAGIYKIERDTLTICYNPRTPGWTRPRAFRLGKDGGALMVLKRVKRGEP